MNSGTLKLHLNKLFSSFLILDELLLNIYQLK